MAKTFRVKIAARRQITLPEEILEMLRIGEGDTLEICIDKNAISGGGGLKLVPTSLFDDGLMERIRQREQEIAGGSGIVVEDVKALATDVAVPVGSVR